jgi:hypothetical protein
VKKPLLILAVALLGLAACKKDDDPNNNNNNNNVSLEAVINGAWEVTDVKRTSDQVIQGTPIYLDFTTQNISQPSTFVFNDTIAEADIRYGYTARDLNTNTPYNSGWMDIEGSFTVEGSLLRVFDSSGNLIIRYNASSISQNGMELSHTDTIIEPGIDLTEYTTERFTLTRL